MTYFLVWWSNVFCLVSVKGKDSFHHCALRLEQSLDGSACVVLCDSACFDSHAYLLHALRGCFSFDGDIQCWGQSKWARPKRGMWKTNMAASMDSSSSSVHDIFIPHYVNRMNFSALILNLDYKITYSLFKTLVVLMALAACCYWKLAYFAGSVGSKQEPCASTWILIWHALKTFMLSR